jgi:hypothetical protein
VGDLIRLECSDAERRLEWLLRDPETLVEEARDLEPGDLFGASADFIAELGLGVLLEYRLRSASGDLMVLQSSCTEKAMKKVFCDRMKGTGTALSVD